MAEGTAEMQDGEFDEIVKDAFKDYNLAMQGKDNFISDNMKVLEMMVDKTSLFKSDS